MFFNVFLGPSFNWLEFKNLIELTKIYKMLNECLRLQMFTFIFLHKISFPKDMKQMIVQRILVFARFEIILLFWILLNCTFLVFCLFLSTFHFYSFRQVWFSFFFFAHFHFILHGFIFYFGSAPTRDAVLKRASIDGAFFPVKGMLRFSSIIVQHWYNVLKVQQFNSTCHGLIEQRVNSTKVHQWLFNGFILQRYNSYSTKVQ